MAQSRPVSRLGQGGYQGDADRSRRLRRECRRPQTCRVSARLRVATEPDTPAPAIALLNNEARTRIKMTPRMHKKKKITGEARRRKRKRKSGPRESRK